MQSIEKEYKDLMAARLASRSEVAKLQITSMCRLDVVRSAREQVEEAEEDLP